MKKHIKSFFLGLLFSLFLASVCCAATKANLVFGELSVGTPARGSDSSSFNRFDMKKSEVVILSNGKFKFPLVFRVKELNGKDVPRFRVTIFWKTPASLAWVGDKLTVQKWSSSRIAVLDNLSIQGGGTKILRKVVTVGPYDGQIILKLDDNNKVAETENYDNTTGAEIFFPGLHYPDLVVKKFKLLTKHPVVGKPVQVEATITRLNDHDIRVTAQEANQKEKFQVGFRCGGSSRLKIVNAEISKLGSPSVKVRTSCTFNVRQKYMITVVADANNAVKELSERNNKKTLSFELK